MSPSVAEIRIKKLFIVSSIIASQSQKFLNVYTLHLAVSIIAANTSADCD